MDKTCTDRSTASCPETESLRQQLIKYVPSSDSSQAPLLFKPSQIANAGWGVFAQVAFKKGQIITEYDGQVIPWEQARKRRELKKASHIRSKIFLTYCIDGSRTREGKKIQDPCQDCVGYGMAAYVNDGKDHKQGNNCEFVNVHCSANSEAMNGDRHPHHSIVCLAALCDIEAGSELFVSYGSDYWKSQLKKSS